MSAILGVSRAPHREVIRQSRSTEHRRGQQFLDQHELLNALRDGGRTLREKIILLQNIDVPFVLRTLDLRQLCADLIRREHASHLGNKPRQFPSEVGMSGGSTGKAHQLLTDKVVEGRREPESSLDRLSRFALFDPNIMRFAYIHSRPSSYRRRQCS